MQPFVKIILITAQLFVDGLWWPLSVPSVPVNVPPVCRFALSAVDMDQRDYDSRTALHIAAAEGDTFHH